MLNNGFVFAAARASQAAADASRAADANDATRNLQGALRRHRTVADRVARQQRRRAAEKEDLARMLQAIRSA